MPISYKPLLLACLVGFAGCAASGQRAERANDKTWANSVAPAVQTTAMPAAFGEQPRQDQSPALGPLQHGQLIPDLGIADPQPAQTLSPPVSAPAATSAVAEVSMTVAAGETVEQLPRAEHGIVAINLPSVLATIDDQHPAVGKVRWQVQQAYAELSQAKALWLPSIDAGFSFHRHDGNYQASNGDIVDVDRNSFQYGLGAGATGAGTTPLPGIAARFHLADAIFLPKVTRNAAWAKQHAACATLNQQLLTAGLAYLELVKAYQDQSIIEESRRRLAELTKITIDHAETGQGLRADADRLRTESALLENRSMAAGERTAVASARLAQAISIDVTDRVVPMDTTAVPLAIVSPGSDGAGGDTAMWVSTALTTRPELKESQALVAAAYQAYRQEKYAPFVPSVLLGFSGGGFGGGLGNDLENVDGRYDFDALLTWRTRNLGFGERAARRQRSAQMQQAKFEKLRVMDQVVREVTEAFAQVEFRQRQIEITRTAIGTAQQSHRLNLERIREGQGIPLEVLQSIAAFEAAQRAHLLAIVGYNQAQLKLQWALGWPPSAGDAMPDSNAGHAS